MVDFKFNVSFSAINCFLNCERNFFYNYILKCKESNTVPVKYGIYGSAMHSVVECKNLNKLKEIYLEKELFSHGYTIEEFKIHSSNCINVLEKYSNNDIMTEHLINFEYYDEKTKIKCNLKGIVDVYIKDKKKIIDWKSSTYNIKKVDNYKKQLLFYGMLIYLKYNIILDEGEVFFAKGKKGEMAGTSHKIKYTKEEILSYKNYVFLILLKIKNKKKFLDYDFLIKNKKKFDSGCFFCPHKLTCNLDKTEDKQIYNIHVINDRNEIRIDINFFDLVFDKVLINEFSYEIENKHFAIAAMAKKGIEFDGIIRLYKPTKRLLPIGFKSKLTELLNQYVCYKVSKKIIINYTDLRRYNFSKIEFKKKSNLILRDYQLTSVNYIINNKRCLCDIATGAGKTLISAEAIYRIKYKTLFVVDVSILLNQTKNEFEKFFDEDIGTITEGKQDWKDINVATIQTISRLIKNNNKEFINNLSSIGVIIIDEAHISKCKSYEKLLSISKAEYIVGLTGTAFATGNNSIEIYKLFSFPDFKISTAALIQSGYLLKPKIKFINFKKESLVLNTDYDYNSIDPLVGELLDINRINELKKVVEKHKEDFILIICPRVVVVEKLYEYLKKYKCEVIYGAVNKTKREDIIKKIKNKEINIIIGTTQIVQKGLDIINLNVLVNYSSNYSDVTTLQSIGRILRLCPGKNEAFYYDFVDKNSINRVNILRKEKFM